MNLYNLVTILIKKVLNNSCFYDSKYIIMTPNHFTHMDHAQISLQHHAILLLKRCYDV